MRTDSSSSMMETIEWVCTRLILCHTCGYDGAMLYCPPFRFSHLMEKLLLRKSYVCIGEARGTRGTDGIFHHQGRHGALLQRLGYRPADHIFEWVAAQLRRMRCADDVPRAARVSRDRRGHGARLLESAGQSHGRHNGKPALQLIEGIERCSSGKRKASAKVPLLHLNDALRTLHRRSRR